MQCFQHVEKRCPHHPTSRCVCLSNPGKFQMLLPPAPSLGNILFSRRVIPCCVPSANLRGQTAAIGDLWVLKEVLCSVDAAGRSTPASRRFWPSCSIPLRLPSTPVPARQTQVLLQQQSEGPPPSGPVSHAEGVRYDAMASTHARPVSGIAKHLPATTQSPDKDKYRQEGRYQPR